MPKVIGIAFLPLLGAALGFAVAYRLLKTIDDAWQRISWG